MLSILGIGTVSAMGCGVASMKATLEGSATRRLEPIPVPDDSAAFEHAVYAGAIDGLDRFIPRRALRRVDKFTRMALLASFLATEDSGLQLEDKSRIGIVFGTAYGPLATTFDYQNTIIEDGDNGASPTLFANSVHNALASALSIFMKVTGPAITITAFERTTAEVLRTAGRWIEEGRVDYVLAGVGDEYCPVLGYALSRLSDGGSGPLQPLKLDHCSYQPGEGCVTLLLGGGDAEGKYGSVREIVSADSPSRLDARLIADHRVVILSANGDRKSGRLYRDVELADTRIA